MAEVYWFKVRDSKTGALARFRRKATLAAIARMGGKKVWGSAEEIPDAEVDAGGFYDPPPGQLADLTPQNRALIDRVAPSACGGPDWDLVELTGVDLNRALDAAREEGRHEVGISHSLL